MAQVFDIRDRTAAQDPLAARLARAIEGEVRFDAASRGRYSTDASIYQIVPQGVVLPRSVADVEAALAIAREEGVSVTARGGGTSQAGQTVGRGLVIDNSKYLDGLGELDPDARTAWVEPGIVLDDLNRQLKPLGLVVSRRHLDQQPGDDRRHGGQQQLRLALAALRHHGRQRAGDRGHPRRWRAGDLRPGAGQPAGGRRQPALPRDHPEAARDRREQRRRHPRALREAQAPGRRLQPRQHRSRRPQHGAPGDRLGGHARLLHADQARAAAAARAQGAGRLPFPELSPGDGRRRSTS